MQGIIVGLAFLVLLGGGYYWYSTQGGNDATSHIVAPEEFFNENAAPQAPTVTESSMPPNNLPPDAVMETGMVPDGTPLPPADDDMASVAREIAITNKGMAFSLKDISVKKGERIKVTFKNGGGTHDWRLEGYNVGTEVLQNGASESVEFVADEAGEFEYYCSVGNHREMGMWGTLTVTE